MRLNFFLGRDMKFLLMIMGMNSATADYACLWCKMFRWDTSKPSDYYNKEMFNHLRANVPKTQTFSKYGGNSQKINSAHILRLGMP